MTQDAIDRDKPGVGPKNLTPATALNGEGELDAIIACYNGVCTRFRPETIDRHRLRLAQAVDARVTGR